MQMLAALLLLAAEPAAAAPAPEREMLDSLKAACDRAGNLEEMKADALAAGWKPMAEEEEPRIAALNKLGRDAIGEDGKATGANYRRKVGGRDVFLILSRYDDKSGFWGAGCRVYDFEATAPFDPAALESWMGKPPTGIQPPAPGLTRILWEPGWRDGITLEVSHVPHGHEIGTKFGLQGTVLIAQAIGGF